MVLHNSETVCPTIAVVGLAWFAWLLVEDKVLEGRNVQ
jgi:hypothetical protein